MSIPASCSSSPAFFPFKPRSAVAGPPLRRRGCAAPPRAQPLATSARGPAALASALPPPALPVRGTAPPRRRLASAGGERHAPPRSGHGAAAGGPACSPAPPRTPPVPLAYPGRGLAAPRRRPGTAGVGAAAAAWPGRRAGHGHGAWACESRGGGKQLGRRPLPCGARLSVSPLLKVLFIVYFGCNLPKIVEIRRKMLKR